MKWVAKSLFRLPTNSIFNFKQNFKTFVIGLLCADVPLRNCSLMAVSVDWAHMHTHPFNGPFSGTTRVSRYQKGKTKLDFTEARDGEWQWHQLGHMQVCTLLQTDNHTSTPPLSFFTGRMPFLPPNQQCQSTEQLTSNRYFISWIISSLSQILILFFRQRWQ